MKILLVTPMPPRPQAPGAIPMILHALLAGLSVRHDLTLVTVAGPDPQEWEAIERLRTSGIEVHAIKRSQLHALPRWQRRWRLASAWLRGQWPWRTVWFWEPEMQQILDRLHAEKHFDLVQVEDNAMGIYRYRTRAPKILTEYEVRRPRPINWHGWSQPGRMAWAFIEADWRRWPLYQRAVWRRFERIQVFTARDAETMRAIMPEVASRIRVNPFGVELPEAADPSREEDKTLVFVGNFTHPPNVDAALWLGHEIMPSLREHCPGVQLLLVGIHPPEPVRALACADIVVTGAVPKIEPYLERAAVVLAPIRTGGGQRMKVLHSMAMGKAVVTTPRGAEGLAIGGCTPPVVVAEDAQGIAAGVAALLDSDATRCELGHSARVFAAEHYNPNAYARRLEAIYAELQIEQTAELRQ